MKRLTLILLFLIPTITIAQNNIIDNQTDSTVISSYIHQALDAMDITAITITVVDETHEYAADNLTVEGVVAYIYRNSPDKWTIVYNMELADWQLKVATAHELIHLKQQYSGKLFNVGNVSFYEGKPFNNDSTEYENRPWENEAFERQMTIANKIN